MAATYFTARAEIEVTFDRILQPGVLAHGNWSCIVANLVRSGVAVCTAAGAVVTCPMILGLPSPGPDVVNFTPPPFDVLSRFDVQAPGFLDFPLAVVP